MPQQSFASASEEFIFEPICDVGAYILSSSNCTEPTRSIAAAETLNFESGFPLSIVQAVISV